MFCKKCGAKLDDNALFCSKCGYAVVNDIQENNRFKGKGMNNSNKKAIMIYIPFILAFALFIFSVVSSLKMWEIVELIESVSTFKKRLEIHEMYRWVIICCVGVYVGISVYVAKTKHVVRKSQRNADSIAHVYKDTELKTGSILNVIAFLLYIVIGIACQLMFRDASILNEASP